jgi:Na+/H+-dicarboxylate symporter
MKRAKAEAAVDLAKEEAGDESQKTQSKKDSPLQFLVNMIPEPMGNSGTMLQVIFFGIFFRNCHLAGTCRHY